VLQPLLEPLQSLFIIDFQLICVFINAFICLVIHSLGFVLDVDSSSIDYTCESNTNTRLNAEKLFPLFQVVMISLLFISFKHHANKRFIFGLHVSSVKENVNCCNFIDSIEIYMHCGATF
jgi:hypothetical protein